MKNAHQREHEEAHGIELVGEICSGNLFRVRRRAGVLYSAVSTVKRADAVVAFPYRRYRRYSMLCCLYSTRTVGDGRHTKFRFRWNGWALECDSGHKFFVVRVWRHEAIYAVTKVRTAVKYWLRGL